MKKIYCVICVKYRKFKNPKISYIFEKTVLSIICSKCKDEKIFKKESIVILKLLVYLKIYNHFKIILKKI